jgi:7-cyano-7-deazaguanine synthase
MKKKVIIISGGMDSTTLLYDLVQQYGAENIRALSFDYGSKHNWIELPLAKKSCEKLGVEHEIINLREIFSHFTSTLLQGGEAIPEGHYAQPNMKLTIVPNRNSILLSCAVGLAESIGGDKVFYGAHGGDHFIYEDCRPEFIKAFSAAEKLGTVNGIEIEAPYSDKNKITILTRGIELGVDYSLTHTCYAPNEKGESCGKCGACCERLEAFKLNNLTDPLVYYNV